MSKWDVTEGERGAVPLLIGLAGPSRSGKTFSALRLATGIQRIAGGDIGVLDTESKRAKHYALKHDEPAKFGKFRFKHLNFEPPYASLRYLEAFKHLQGLGCKTIIIDSMSHEHEGAGGYLEQHEAETVRMMNEWHVPRGKAQMSAWQMPSANRTKLMLEVVNPAIHVILCFRCKEKIEMLTKQKQAELKAAGELEGDESVRDAGWMAIGGQELLYSLTIRALLLPGANGVPTWIPSKPGEKKWIGVEEEFRSFFMSGPPKPFDEEQGEALARWASGGELTARPPHPMDEKVAEWIAAYETCKTAEEWSRITDLGLANGKALAKHQAVSLTAAKKTAQARLGIQ
jgi:hypothetical protein